MSKYHGGGTVVVKDSRGRVRCFFGHVCGSGHLEAYMERAESLNGFDKVLKEESHFFAERPWPDRP